MKIKIVCTCGGSLRPWRIGFVLEIGGRSPVGQGCERMFRDDTGTGRGWRLHCLRCHRAPEFSLERWARLVAGYDAAGRDTLDISARTLTDS